MDFGGAFVRGWKQRCPWGARQKEGLFKMEMERYIFHIIAESALEGFDADWTGMWVFMRIVWQSDAACLRQGRFERRASGFVCRKVGPECVFSRASGLCPDARGRSSWLPTFPSGLLPLPAGLRRAPPAPAQGPSALENPVCCRAYLATLHPRPSGLLSPSAGLRRAPPAPAQGPSALENPLCCRVQPEVSRASPNPQRRQAPKPEPAVVALPLHTIPKRNKAAPPPKRGVGPRRSFAVATGCRHCRPAAATGRRHCRPERGGRRCGRWLF